jgi:tetratricopeptide (TPR) repeat protein
LMDAAGNNQLAAAKLLLELGANINATDNSYMPRTALFEAVSEGHEEMARFLLENKADPNAMFMTHGGTARNCLEFLKNMKKDTSSSVYKMLVEYGAILPTMFDMLDKYPDQATKLTESFVAAEKYPQALELIDYLLNKKPEPVLHYQRGVVYDMTGRVDEALAEFNTAIRLDPSNDKALYSRSLMHQKKERWPESLADLEAAIQINATDYYTKNALAVLLLRAPTGVGIGTRSSSL